MSIFDGTSQFTFMPQSGAHVESGVIDALTSSDDGINVHLSPLFYTIRPSSVPSPLVSDANYTIENTPEHFGGVECIVLKERSSARSGDSNDEIWVDGKTFLPRRLMFYSGATLFASSSIEYVPNDQIGAVPKRWTATVFSPSGTVQEASESEVVDYAINIDLPKDEFTMTFPPGTRVVDKRDKQRDLYVDEHGKLVPWTGEPRRSLGIPWRALVVANMIFALAVLIFLWRRQRRVN